jgi:hypothetical protein
LSIASYCHKKPSSTASGPITLSYHQGASLVDLQGPRPTVKAASSRPAKRQQIGDWSRASRHHLRQFLASLRIDDLKAALVITLTYPAEFPAPEQFKTYKNHLRVFNQALHRRFPGASGVWKLEFQQRGAAHFHLLAFGLHGEALDTLRTWITARWYALAHNSDKHLGSAACEVDPVKHHGGFIHYMASYIAKNDQTRPGDFTGRYWGVFNRQRLPIGELHTLELTPQQWVRVRRLARKKMSIDIERRRWSLFFKDINPRQPAPGPDHGILMQHPAALGNRLWWEQLKSAHHSGARRFHAFQQQPAEWREHEGEQVLIEQGFSYATTSTKIVPAFRPPSRAKPRHLDHFRLLCHADTFINAISRGVSSGLI